MDAKMKVERAAAGAAIRWCFKICESRRRQNKSAVESDGFCTEIYRKYVCGENHSTSIRTMLQNPDNKWYSMSTADWTSWIRR